MLNLTLLLAASYVVSCQVCTAIVISVLTPMNVNKEGSRKTAQILNHVVLSLSFFAMVVDTIKMVFVADEEFDVNTVTDGDVGVDERDL